MIYGKYTVTLSDDRNWTVCERDTMNVVGTYKYGNAEFKAAQDLMMLLNHNASFEMKA
jgi:hypothetical protein